MELMTEQIKNYSRTVDAFNKKLNIEIPVKLKPIMAAYLKSVLNTDCDQHARDEAIVSFSSEVHAILSDGLKDYLTMQSETHHLKSIATEELCDILCRLEKKFGESFQISRQFLKDYIDDFSIQGKVTTYHEKMRQNGLETKVILSDQI